MYLAAEFVTNFVSLTRTGTAFVLTAYRTAIAILCRRKRGAVTRMCRKNSDNLRESPIPLLCHAVDVAYLGLNGKQDGGYT